VSSSEASRLIAWNDELIAAHRKLRAALAAAQDALDGGEAESAHSDLLLYCHGFCVALGGHHVGEDTNLFPELLARHPSLARTIAALEQDHAMIGTLLARFERAIQSSDSDEALALHLEGLAAIMESHFRYEERQLLDVLATLELDADPRAVFGPL
jgi:hemerythrin-like domain-containing protein